MTIKFVFSRNLSGQRCGGKKRYAIDCAKSNHLDKRNAFDFFCGKVRVLSKLLNKSAFWGTQLTCSLYVFFKSGISALLENNAWKILA